MVSPLVGTKPLEDRRRGRAPFVPEGDRPHDGFHVGDAADAIAVMVGPVETERGTPVVHHEHDGFRSPDHGIDEGSEIFAVGREAVGVGIGIGQFGGIAHADHIRRDQPAASRKPGNDVAPEIGRGRIAVQKQHRRALAAFMIGHAAVEHIDGLLGERLFGHVISLDTPAR
jgi:hypothetical protein